MGWMSGFQLSCVSDWTAEMWLGLLMCKFLYTLCRQCMVRIKLSEGITSSALLVEVPVCWATSCCPSLQVDLTTYQKLQIDAACQRWQSIYVGYFPEWKWWVLHDLHMFYVSCVSLAGVCYGCLLAGGLAYIGSEVWMHGGAGGKGKRYHEPIVWQKNWFFRLALSSSTITAVDGS